MTPPTRPLDAADSPSAGDRSAEILDAALSLPAGERAAFLIEACAHDVVLHAELVSMLTAHEAAGGFLAPCADDADRGAIDPITALDFAPGAVIDRYRLVKVIGTGGFGVVYAAEQSEPVRRQVALKIIKLGMDTRQVIARFETERQALALMDHTGIAKVFDAGATPQGRPYFVMELVRGVPISTFCNEEHLNIQERVLLVIQVCQAIQHAHQKGVIHRDIKPSNVLVTRQDDVAIPKVIDFGIARATGAEFTEQTLTATSHIVGTPAYMSPEQAATFGADVDTRTDIYSLGVLLYELLTGALPFDTRKLLNAGYEEMIRMIRSEDPLCPSKRLSTLHLASPSAGRSPGPEVLRFSAELRGDLDWIVMKCLEKERTRRYASAAALAEDLQRYLDDEPVEARPPSRGYRMRKFVRRHRGSVATAAALVSMLCIATAVSVAFAWRESEQRQRADREAAEARRQTQAAQLAQSLAETRAEETRQVASFQSDLLRGLDAAMLGGAIREEFRTRVREALTRRSALDMSGQSPRSDDEIEAEMARFDALTGAVAPADVARSVLDQVVLARAGETLETQFAGQPLVHAQIRDSLGAAYRALGLFDAAETHYRAALQLRRDALGAEHPEIAISLNNIATMEFNRGEFEAAEALCRQALAMQRKLIGPQDVELAYTLNNLATVLNQKNQWAEAEALCRESLAMRRKLLGDLDPVVADTLNNLAGMTFGQGDRAGAEALFREALEIQRATRGPESIEAATTLSNLGSVRRSYNDLAGAEALERESLALLRQRYSADHPSIGSALNDIALLRKQQGDFANAEVLYREALAIRRKSFGDRNVAVAETLNNLAVMLRDRGDQVAAEPLARESLSIFEEVLPPGHPQTASTRATLGRIVAKSTMAAHVAVGQRDARLAEAEELLSLACAQLAAAPAAPPQNIRRAHEFLAELYDLRASATPGQGYETKASALRATLAPAPN